LASIIKGTPVVPGAAEGIALVSDEPLSFWGGYDFETGEITDRRHPLSGAKAAGAILALPSARGSSTTTAVLLEAVRNGTAPAALITTRVDVFFALASIVAREMYDRAIPTVSVTPAELRTLRTGDRLTIEPGGMIEVMSTATDWISQEIQAPPDHSS
jgi:predicted aconitase with swiveling domain